jgi:hypothetical protein
VVKHGLKHITGAETFNAGDVLGIACKPGYDRVGERHVKCQKDGTWDSPVPHCKLDERISKLLVYLRWL